MLFLHVIVGAAPAQQKNATLLLLNFLLHGVWLSALAHSQKTNAWALRGLFFLPKKASSLLRHNLFFANGAAASIPQPASLVLTATCHGSQMDDCCARALKALVTAGTVMLSGVEADSAKKAVSHIRVKCLKHHAHPRKYPPTIYGSTTSNCCARDAKGLALFCEGDSRNKKSRSEAEPVAARPGALIINPNNNLM